MRLHSDGTGGSHKKNSFFGGAELKGVRGREGKPLVLLPYRLVGFPESHLLLVANQVGFFEGLRDGRHVSPWHGVLWPVVMIEGITSP